MFGNGFARLTIPALGLTLLGCAVPAHSGDLPGVPPPPATQTTGFVKRSIEMNGESFRYQLFIPADYDPSRPWPVILFLHGAGERGSDNEAQTTVGLGPVVRARAEDFPAIVIFPQMPLDSTWAGTVADAALRVLDSTMLELNVDPERIYLTGMSMGGYGTWQLATQEPRRFAALVPVCGGVHPPRSERPDLRVRTVPPGTPDAYRWVAERVRGVPTWIFHGEADQVVPVTGSRRMNDALRAAGAEVHYTEYPGVGHNAWDPAYSEPELWEWLFTQRRAR